jgi:hypothetical protein
LGFFAWDRFFCFTLPCHNQLINQSMNPEDFHIVLPLYGR